MPYVGDVYYLNKKVWTNSEVPKNDCCKETHGHLAIGVQIDTVHVLTLIYLRRQQNKGQNTDWSSPQAHMHARSNALTGFLYLWNKLIFWGIGYVELPIMIIQNFRQVSPSIN